MMLASTPTAGDITVSIESMPNTIYHYLHDACRYSTAGDITVSIESNTKHYLHVHDACRCSTAGRYYSFQ